MNNLEVESVWLSYGQNGQQREFFHRHSQADQTVMQEIFNQQVYSFHRLRRSQELQRIYQNILQSNLVPLILDAGAHIGASVIHWSFHFPQAHITAWEPDAANFTLLQMNTTGLDVDLRWAAIGAVAGSMALVDPGEDTWGYRTIEAEDGVRVPVEALYRVVAEKQSAGYIPFIAKIDIEGGESHLFSQHTDWIDLFPILVVELHDWLLPHTANSQNFLRCLSQRNRDFVFLGENVFSLKNNES